VSAHSKPPKRPAFGNTVHGGEARELGESTGWVEWNQALEQSERQFAHTAPMTDVIPPEGGDRRYAKTRPAGLSTSREAAKPSRRKARLTADQAMVEARRNNRVCPRQRRWAELFGQLAQWAPESADLPSPPLTGDAWNRTPALAKRMAFRDHIEWADRHECLDKLMDFLKALPEEEWHHMGD
jgi:hypothetical protein